MHRLWCVAVAVAIWASFLGAAHGHGAENRPHHLRLNRQKEDEQERRQDGNDEKPVKHAKPRAATANILTSCADALAHSMVAFLTHAESWKLAETCHIMCNVVESYKGRRS